MKKLFLVLAILIGVSLSSLSFASQVGNELSPYRTIKLNAGVVLHANTLVVAHGGVLRYISGVANSSNAVWTIYDSATLAGAQDVVSSAGVITTRNSNQNILVEGGQATQYGPEGPIDLGDAGINFVNGLVVMTTTADLTLLYY
jgi:hypothetical protein